MLKNLRIVRPLIPGRIGGWLSLALVGSILLALLDTLGVAAMLPLMQVITTGDTKSGVAGTISELLGTSELQTIIIALSGIVGLAFVVKSCFSVTFRWWLLGRTTRMMAQASTELMRRYVLAPYSKHKARNLPEVFRNIGAAVPQAFSQVLLGALTLVADLLTLLAMAAILLAVSPLATLFAGVILGLASAVIQRVMRRHLLAAGESGAEADLEAWSALLPGLEGFREARLTSSAGNFINGFSKAKSKSADAQRRMSMFSELPKYALEITFMIAIIGMTAVLFATSTASAAVATLGVFAAASLRMLPTLNRVTATMASMKSGSVGLDILAGAVQDLDRHQMHSEVVTSDARYSGDIEIHDLVYRYPDADVSVLNGLTLKIRAGKTTAFVGSSGAGKSTLLDLILGLATPTSGSILAGGRPVSDDLAAWYKTLGVVPQEVYLTNSTLRENIAYGLAPNEVDETQLDKALKDSQLYDFVETLPEKLDTVLGERGVRLSGGQRQRVGIARALYRQPRYLILDEATSALDNVTERQITDTIDALRGRMTVIVVAHRLSTVKNADTIIFLNKGHASSVGTFEELRASNAEFDNLVRLGQLS